MRRGWCLFVAAAAMAGVVPGALAAHTHVPTPSTWRLNVGQSDFGGGPAMKSDEMVVTTDTDKWLKFSDVTVDPDGKVYRSSWSGPQNGTPRPLVGMPGAKASFNTADDSSRWMMADGSETDGVISLSGDKKTATIRVKVRMKDGKEFSQTLVYDRVK